MSGLRFPISAPITRTDQEIRKRGDRDGAGAYLNQEPEPRTLGTGFATTGLLFSPALSIAVDAGHLNKEKDHAPASGSKKGKRDSNAAANRDGTHHGEREQAAAFFLVRSVATKAAARPCRRGWMRTGSGGVKNRRSGWVPVYKQWQRPSPLPHSL